ncbi:MAG: CRISPR system precrRNA processing endoribonuclease RAMP protein Cas6 [Desulfatiglandales bacterium]
MQIPYQKYTFTIEAVEELHLPYYKGSTFRGGFGNMFKKVACALRRQDCTDCMLRSRCIYAYVFETPSFEGAEIMNMHKYEKVPHPFVIEPPLIGSDFNPESRGILNKSWSVSPGEKIEFNLILIGRATEYLPYFIFTFDELGKIGIGKGRGKYRLIEVSIANDSPSKRICVYNESERTVGNIHTDEIYIPDDFRTSDKVSELTLHLITPLRIKYNRDLVVKLGFHILIRNLLRRLGLLYYFHCGQKKPIWDHREIIDHAESIKILDSRLKWYDWERYSFRQNTRMRLGGLLGEIAYSGEIEPFMPLLRAGEILHAGKGTSFGLGKYRIAQKKDF